MGYEYSPQERNTRKRKQYSVEWGYPSTELEPPKKNPDFYDKQVDLIYKLLKIRYIYL